MEPGELGRKGGKMMTIKELDDWMEARKGRRFSTFILEALGDMKMGSERTLPQWGVAVRRGTSGRWKIESRDSRGEFNHGANWAALGINSGS
jgi:hypothetical protein